MSKVTKETVMHTAELALLKFSEEELSNYTLKFKRVLEYVDKLKKLETAGIEPTSHPMEDVICPMREDKMEKFADSDSILSIMPEKNGRLLEVPKVIEND